MDPETVRAVQRVHHGGTTDTDLLDFSANVNPETPEGAERVYRDAFDEARRYPDDEYEAFRSAAAAAVDCSPEQVVPTAGGLEALRLAVSTTVTTGDSVLLPAPSFGEYAREVELQGGDPTFVPHDELTSIDRTRLADAALVIVCTPNNPTGDAPSPQSLHDLAARCRAVETTLLVDEAFLGFTARDSLAGTEGVVVARSLTKLYGLPGLRAGYAVATGPVLRDLQTAREPWTLGVPAAAVGTHCLRDRSFVRETRRRVRRERERLRDALDDAFDVAPSDAPFLLLDVGERNVDELLERARAAGVAIRDARTFRGLDRHVRVAVRTPAENDRLLAALGVEVDDGSGSVGPGDRS